jgi:hypothetical protein
LHIGCNGASLSAADQIPQQGELFDLKELQEKEVGRGGRSHGGAQGQKDVKIGEAAEGKLYRLGPKAEFPV